MMAEKWIAGATSNAHGQFRRKAEAAGKSTAEFAREHAHDSGKLGKQARLAATLMGLNRKSPEERMKSRYEKKG
jgi:hypothetical protein